MSTMMCSICGRVSVPAGRWGYGRDPGALRDLLGPNNPRTLDLAVGPRVEPNAEGILRAWAPATPASPSASPLPSSCLLDMGSWPSPSLIASRILVHAPRQLPTKGMMIHG